MELHPHFQQQELFDFVRGNGIVPIGYSPLGSPGRPERDRTPEDTVDIGGPGHRRASPQRLGVHPGSRLPEMGHPARQVPIPFSVKRRNFLANLQAAVTRPAHRRGHGRHRGDRPELPPDQGPGFPLERRPDLGSLWDLDGEITPA